MPKEKKRTMPIRLSVPVMLTEQIVIDLPSQWKVTESEVSLKDQSCEYNSVFTSSGNRVYLRADYENFKDHVSVEDAPHYLENMKTFDKTENYELTYGLEGVVGDENHTPIKNILITFLVIAAIIGLFIWWTQKK